MMIRPALILALAISAAACASPREEASRDLKTPLDQYPFQVNQHPEEIMLAVHPEGVSGNQAAALAELVRRWKGAGGDPIVVRAPGNGPQEADAARMAEQIRSVLLAEGAPVHLVRVERFDAAGDGSVPLTVGFARYVADVPECGLKWDNLTGTQSNSVPNTFGCSVRANMAAQVANPRDLVQARAEDPYESSRGTVQTGQWRTGADTASTAPIRGGTVSQAVQ